MVENNSIMPAIIMFLHFPFIGLWTIISPTISCLFKFLGCNYLNWVCGWGIWISLFFLLTWWYIPFTKTQISQITRDQQCPISCLLNILNLNKTCHIKMKHWIYCTVLEYSNNTSPCFLGIIVALAIFSSIWRKTPLESSDALKNVPELLPSVKNNKFLQWIASKKSISQKTVHYIRNMTYIALYAVNYLWHKFMHHKWICY